MMLQILIPEKKKDSILCSTQVLVNPDGSFSATVTLADAFMSFATHL